MNSRETRILVVGGIDNKTDNETHRGLSSAELYQEMHQKFVATGSMSEGRTGHEATLLTNGQVLITGGDGAKTNHPIASAELYDPNTDTFSLVENMGVARVGHAAVRLSNGLVLITGGQDSNFMNLNTAELFDPSTKNFRPAARMMDARTGHSATLLNDGNVLIAGGENGKTLLPSAELYDPSTNTFHATGGMSIPRLFAPATLLSDGKVLIAGGGSLVGNASGQSVASAEIYDPASGQFANVGRMGTPRRGHVMIALGDHNVLAAGGINDELPDPQRFLNSAELFDVRTLKFSPASSMKRPRFDHSAVLLNDGRVLVTGGFTGGFPITDTAEIFDLREGFIATGSMTDARAEHTVTSIR